MNQRSQKMVDFETRVLYGPCQTLLIREIRAALGTWKWKGKGNVLGSRAAGGRQPAE